MNAAAETGLAQARVAFSPLFAMERPIIALAAEMQNTLVPPLSYRGDSVEANGLCVPKEQVGGDLMDLVAKGPEVIVYVADISGHGLRAGVLMGMIKTAIRYGLLLGRPLTSLISDLNRLLPQVKEPSMFATLALLRFDGSKQAEYISAGHVPILHFRIKTKDVVSRYAQQCPLGLLAGNAYVSWRIHFEVGDIFLLPTDGAVELDEERDVEAGLEILAHILCKFHELPLMELLEILRNEISRQGAAHDDRTVVLVRAIPRGESHAELGCQPQPRDTFCRELLESKWHKVLAGLAAGLTDE